MKQLLFAVVAVAFVTLGGVAFAEDGVGRVDTNIVAQSQIKGEVLKVDGDSFVVKDERSKKEVKFTMEKDVRATLDRPLKQGDRIEAFLTPEGYAKTVRMENVSIKDQDMTSKENKAGKSIGDVQAPGTIDTPKGDTGKGRGGTKSDEGSNPTLSPSGKGSATGG
jgi:hypothetical protein